MSTADKKLLILIDYTDLQCVDRLMLQSCDKLSMTPGAVMAFEEKDLVHKTPFEIYNAHAFRQDNLKLIKDVEDLFVSLDRKYQSVVHYPRCFIGHIYHFLVYFADLLFICRLCEIINGRYKEIYIVGDDRDVNDVRGGFKSRDNWNFSIFSLGIDNKVGMLKKGLEPECICSGDTKDKTTLRSLDSARVIRFLPRVGLKIIARIQYLWRKVRSRRHAKTIFVIQDKYEVWLLERFMRDFSFIRPLDRGFWNHGKTNDNSSEIISPLFGEEVERFVKKWFFQWREEVFGLLNFYHSEVICRLKWFSQAYEQVFEHYKPAALLYAVGSNMVYEDMCAYYANNKNIPVFYFQHGGATIFLITHIKNT